MFIFFSAFRLPTLILLLPLPQDENNGGILAVGDSSIFSKIGQSLARGEQPSSPVKAEILELHADVMLLLFKRPVNGMLPEELALFQEFLVH